MTGSDGKNTINNVDSEILLGAGNCEGGIYVTEVIFHDGVNFNIFKVEEFKFKVHFEFGNDGEWEKV